MLVKGFQLFTKITVVVVILNLAGGHYLILQVAAWTQMIIAYSETEPITQALQKTFDGNHPCNLCISIEKAKQTDKKQDVVQINLKQELFCSTERQSILNHPEKLCHSFQSDLNPYSSSERPLLPPPRSLCR